MSSLSNSLTFKSPAWNSLGLCCEIHVLVLRRGRQEQWVGEEQSIEMGDGQQEPGQAWKPQACRHKTTEHVMKWGGSWNDPKRSLAKSQFQQVKPAQVGWWQSIQLDSSLGFVTKRHAVWGKASVFSWTWERARCLYAYSGTVCTSICIRMYIHMYIYYAAMYTHIHMRSGVFLTGGHGLKTFKFTC